MTRTLHALVIDDEPAVAAFVADLLRAEDWQVTEAATAEEAFEKCQSQSWGAVFSDIHLGKGGDGFTVLRQLKEQMPTVPVVLMTGYASASGALDAASSGAYDYVLKPFRIEELQSIAQTLREQVLNDRSRRGRSPTTPTNKEPDLRLLGRSHKFIEVMKQVGQVASTDLPVLLTGESGTGKEVVASALHSRSLRRDFPFITVNCATMPAELIESELFGHLRGSFTGADQDREGLWAAADNGTIFLDEITETSTAFQVKLLRTLQYGEIRPVGSNKTQRVNVRVIAASNRNVEQEIAAGRFREDLFYRLNALSIRLPPLRERREDILLLAKSVASRVHPLRPPVQFSGEALDLIQQYPWPGNIRELENAVVLATAVCDGTIRVKNLPERLQEYSTAMDNPTPLGTVSEVAAATPPKDYPPLAVIEGRYVEEVLAHTQGNKQAAARLLNIDRKTLDRTIKRHRNKI